MEPDEPEEPPQRPPPGGKPTKPPPGGKPTKPPPGGKPTKPPPGGGGGGKPPPGNKPTKPGKPTKPPGGGGGGGGSIGTGGGRPTGPTGKPIGAGGDINVTIKPGMGNGAQHALNKSFKGNPFPAQGGVLASFDITFNQGYEWGCRGKIGGFHVGNGKASGGQHSDTGASFRMCWNKGGGAFAYVYVPNGTSGQQPRILAGKNGQWGLLIWEKEFAGVFTAGKATRVEMGIRLNKQGGRDGSMMLKIGDRVQNLDGITWRNGNQPVSFFGLGIFHGGPCKATKTSSLVIRNLTFRSW